MHLNFLRAFAALGPVAPITSRDFSPDTKPGVFLGRQGGGWEYLRDDTAWRDKHSEVLDTFRTNNLRIGTLLIKMTGEGLSPPEARLLDNLYETDNVLGKTLASLTILRPDLASQIHEPPVNPSPDAE